MDDFLNMMEIVSKDRNVFFAELTELGLDYLTQYADEIKSDLSHAKEFGVGGNFQFNDVYKAVYHYRMHRNEFNNCTIEEYLTGILLDLFQDDNIIKVFTLEVQQQRKNGTLYVIMCYVSE